MWAIAAHLALIPLAMLTLIPFIWLVTASLKSSEDFFTSAFLPKGDGPLGIAWDRITLDHYIRLFEEIGIGRALLNSVFLASTTAILATLCCAAGGYALARLKFRGNLAMTVLVLGALLVPPPLLLAPTYQVLYQFGLLDTFSGLILPAIAPAFGVFLFRQAVLQSVPPDLLEASRLDGCSEIGIFFAVVLPLVKPMIGAFLLITFLGTWNNFISPQVVLQTAEKFPLSVAVAQLRGVYKQDYGLLMAGTMISILPPAVLFLMLQKEFVSGLTSGAVKS
ncbi:MAG: carbohydrate ABC transporter permease [Planctomycetota bacterium]|nr:MAG: carbohydrate ABC transporter permease [Planctomycetota bacterium]